MKSNGNGKNGPKFFIVGKGEHEIKKQPSVPEQVDILCEWLKERRLKLKGVSICFEYVTDEGVESVGMKTTEMKFRDIQYMLLDGLMSTWFATRGK